jgi:2'-5' RNA ligase
MRMFIAIELPSEVKAHLAELQKKLDGHFAQLILAKEIHLTLKFLGEVDEQKIAEIKQKLEKVDFGSFDASLGKPGVFPNESYVRVVWIGVEPAESIIALQNKIEKSLAGLFEQDTRFSPHLTLARVKFVKDKQAFIENLKKLEAGKNEFLVSSFKLIKSTLTPKGPVYETIAEFKSQADAVR